MKYVLSFFSLSIILFCLTGTVFAQDTVQIAAPASAETPASVDTPPAPPAAPEVTENKSAQRKMVRDAREFSRKYLWEHRKEGATSVDAEAYALEQVKAKAAAGDYGTVTERDWNAFFTALADFIEKILPLILELIDAFGT